jgi:predicted transcriptional regulator
MARSKGRSRSFLATEAISAYLDDNEWQISGISAALSWLDRGKGIPHHLSSLRDDLSCLLAMDAQLGLLLG